MIKFLNTLFAGTNSLFGLDKSTKKQSITERDRVRHRNRQREEGIEHSIPIDARNCKFANCAWLSLEGSFRGGSN
eukprot:2917335-Pleurochrysis_carterae.AAC.2